MDLTDKNVVYIGGFGGIGQECVKGFLQKGIKNLVIMDLVENIEFTESLRSSFSNAKIFYIKVDLTNKDQIKSAYEEAKEKIDHFDVVVNGSGILNDNLIDLTIQINLLGLIHSTLIALDLMNKSKGGNGGIIVNISSVAGLEPASMIPIYSGSKFGVAGFTRALASPLYYRETGVAFITICPGVTDTSLVRDPSERQAFDMSKPLSDMFSKIKRQSKESCAENLIKAVELAKNGSVWLLDIGEMKEVEIPVFWSPQL